MKLSPTLRIILSRLLYAESWETLIEETGFHPGALRSDLSTLISRGFVEVFDEDQKKSLSPFFDADQMHRFTYKATHIGLKQIQNTPF